MNGSFCPLTDLKAKNSPAMARSKSLVSRRLSKPRIESADQWQDAQLDGSSLSNPSELDFFREPVTVTSIQGDRRSSRRSRSKIRAYLYGQGRDSSPDSLSSSDIDDDESRNGLASAARGAKKRLSRTGSSIMQLSSAKTSTNLLTCPPTPNVLYSFEALESARIADEIKEKAQMDALAAQNHVSIPVDEENATDPLLAPVRRKSLYTPGIATRHPSDILRKPPPPQSLASQADRDYYYNPACPESSPLSKIVALSLNNDGRSTPSSFTELGGLKLGTLRVTNGPSSPTTDAVSDPLPRPCSAASIDLDDVRTVVGGSDNCEKLTPDCVALSFPASSEKTFSQIVKSDDIAVLTQSLQSPTGGDPTNLMAHDYMSELGDGPFIASKTSEPLRPAVDSFYPEDDKVLLPNNMFECSNTWAATSTETQDRGTRDDAYARLTGAEPSSQLTSQQDHSSSDTRPSGSLDKAPASDSGYSSCASSGVDWWAKNDKGPSEPENVTNPVPRPRMNTDHRRGYSQSGFVTKIYPTISPEPVTESAPSVRSRTLARKIQKDRPQSQPPLTKTITVQGPHEESIIPIPQVPSEVAARHAERLIRFPQLNASVPSALQISSNRIGPFRKSRARLNERPTVSQNKPREATVAESEKENAQLEGVQSLIWSDATKGKTKKLQKRIVKEQKEAKKQAMKQELELKMAKRANTDKAEPQGPKNSTSNHTRSRSQPRLPSWTRSKSTEKPLSEQEVRASIADFGTVTESIGSSPYDIATMSALQPSAVHMAVRQPSAYVPSQYPYQLGLARRTTRQAPHMKAASVQITSDMEQEWEHKSYGNKKPAADMPFHGSVPARMKSLPKPMVADVAPVVQVSAKEIHLNDDMPAGGRLPHRAAIPSRKAQSGGMRFNDRGGIPGKSIRPRSLAMDTPPPVPALPSANHVEQQEERWAKGRHSMIIDFIEDRDWDAENKRMDSLEEEKETNGEPEEVEPMTTSEFARQLAHGDGEDEAQQDDEAFWEAPRKAWYQRRKSAGEALSQKASMEMGACTCGSTYHY